MTSSDTSAVTPFEAGDVVVLTLRGLEDLIAHLDALGYQVLGPTLSGGAIVPRALTSITDLPRGVHDVQAPGSYRVVRSDDEELFGWAVGPESWKQEHFPSSQVMWRSEVVGEKVMFREPERSRTPLAIFGARPCEVAALRILDRVLEGGVHRDERYCDRRDSSFIAVVECAKPAETCFCDSMKSGPGIAEGFDLALTELRDEVGHRFVTRIGSRRGAEVLSAIVTRPASDGDLVARALLLERASRSMSRTLPFDDVASLLARNAEHPRWDVVAERCLSCGNCTMVCPTCFCSDVRDTTDLTGATERRRTWSSCFDLEHSYVHGGSVRESTSSRYRQWISHKLSTWWDQFDASGCVGCGRCIVWCPVGIDITEEVAAVAANIGAPLETAATGSVS